MKAAPCSNEVRKRKVFSHCPLFSVKPFLGMRLPCESERLGRHNSRVLKNSRIMTLNNLT
jgi:hypothetical protein